MPILIVYALVNRPYMVDLQSDRSLVKNLLAQGEDIYLIDWGYPDRADRWLTLDDYINGYIRAASMRSRTPQGRKDQPARHLPGRRVLAVLRGDLPGKVKNLITMVTPVDFHTPDNMLSHWMRGLDADLFVDTLGNVPADLMNWCYLTLKPVRLNQQKYIGLVDILDDKTELENFLRMEKWIFDTPDQAGEAFRQFIKDFYQGNKLVNGGLKIGDTKWTSTTSRCRCSTSSPSRIISCRRRRPRVLGRIGTKDYTQLAFKGGHIGIYVSGRAQREVPPAIHDWLAQR